MIASSDDYVYALGGGYSLELTNSNSADVYLVKYSYDGTSMSYFKHFGGKQPDVGTDMKLVGANIYILGYSISKGQLSQGNDDIFVISCKKSNADINWVKYIGTEAFFE